MANIASQEKRNQRSLRERLENRRYTSSVKTYFRRLEAAVGDGDTERADGELRTLVSTIDRAVKPTTVLARSLAQRNSARVSAKQPRARASG
jgi:small subunit ribosomal protein S20